MNKTEIINDFEKLIAIQSISTDKKYFPHILEAVSFLEKKLEEVGFEVEIFKKDNASPLIIATVKTNKTSSKTIGIYVHYDVQPADPLSEWQTEPFRLTLKNGKFFGRGTADDKGHLVINLAAVESLIKDNKLENNIVFIIEGEEEIGSMHFEEYVKEAKDILSKVDVFYVMDMGMHGRNMPQIFYGLRGLVGFELDVFIGETDLHSGIYGNRVFNPIQVLSELIVKIKNSQTGRILIPGFYDRVRRLKKEEIELLQKVKRTDEEEKEEAKVFGLTSSDKINPFLSTKVYPSFDIHGITAGYTGEGIKTVIPKSAHLKFSFRLVEYQDPDEVKRQAADFIKANLPQGVKYNLKINESSSSFYTGIDNQYAKKTALILEEVFGNETLFNRSGGSIAACEILQRLYKKPIILTGFTLPDENVHAPNENFDEEMFFCGIQALEMIYSSI